MFFWLLYILLFISLIITIYFIYRNLVLEKWCNTYSGWPGPLESPYRSNIPALYGNPKYESKCNFKYNPNSKTGYLSMKQLPN